MKNYNIYFIHIRDCLHRIKDYNSGGKDVFFADTKTQDAVIRNLEVMIESIKQLPPEWLEDYSEVPWSRVVGFRNQLAHEYLTVDLQIIWEVITVFLPPLESAIESMIHQHW